MTLRLNTFKTVHEAPLQPLVEEWQMVVSSHLDYKSFPSTTDYQESSLIGRVLLMDATALLDFMERIVQRPFAGSEWLFDEAFERFNALHNNIFLDMGWIRSSNDTIHAENRITAEGAAWIFNGITRSENPAVNVRLENIQDVFREFLRGTVRDCYLFLQNGSHTMPIYMERRGKMQIRLIATDASGGGEKEEYYKGLVNALRRCGFQGEVYLSEQSRQFTAINCAVFGVCDLLKIFKRQQLVLSGVMDIFEWAQIHKTERRERCNRFLVYGIDRLPTEMVKSIQSCSRLYLFFLSMPEIYQGRPQTWELSHGLNSKFETGPGIAENHPLPIYKSTGEPEDYFTLFRCVQKHIRSISILLKDGSGKEKLMNCLIQDRAMKYKLKMCRFLYTNNPNPWELSLYVQGQSLF